jgi:hypothetical protein
MAKGPQILTANRLRDGDVVYWSAGRWLPALSEADIFVSPEDGETALAAAAETVRGRVVVNPYLFPVHLSAGAAHPVEEREIIRAAGPTVRLDLGKQARHVPV